VNPWQRAALVALAAGAFWLDRAEADCAIDNYSAHMDLTATTPPDESWPAGVQLTQLDETTITWMATAGGQQTVDLRATLR
jgi:hypothetical protein